MAGGLFILQHVICWLVFGANRWERAAAGEAICTGTGGQALFTFACVLAVGILVFDVLLVLQIMVHLALLVLQSTLRMRREPRAAGDPPLQLARLAARQQPQRRSAGLRILPPPTAPLPPSSTTSPA